MMEADEIKGLALAYVGIFITALVYFSIFIDVDTGDYFIAKPQMNSVGGIFGNQMYSIIESCDEAFSKSEICQIIKESTK